jgi:hypothetical protein
MVYLRHESLVVFGETGEEPLGLADTTREARRIRHSDENFPDKSA